MAEENKLVPRIMTNGMWEVIRTPGGGEIPDVLKGMYTSGTTAQRHIDMFQAELQAKVSRTPRKTTQKVTKEEA